MANFERAFRVGAANWPASNCQPKAAHLNQVDIDHVEAINGDDGSTHAPTSQIVVGGAGVRLDGPLDLLDANAVVRRRVADWQDYDQQTWGTDQDTYRLTPPGADRNHDMVAAGTSGRRVAFVCPASGGAGHLHTIRRSGFGPGDYIVRLDAAGWSSCVLEDDGTNWRLLEAYGSFTAGPHA